ncbi:P-loop NTPase fold protein [Streptomyces sp. GbtcB7]|uniref:P-loop NTPase fold protein n=1 Tax=Streptomyces sp. GbtcB7 TaxID=2824752 RepID=UPI001C2F8338|nr:P-loop NTPase fold protein [Streptomyces sp. GbtcB7]
MFHHTGQGQSRWTWDRQSDEELYGIAVRASMAEPEISKHYGAREVTRPAVRAAAYEPEFISEAFDSTRTLYVSYRRAARSADQVQAEYEAALDQLVLDWPLRLLVGCLVAVPTWIFIDVAFTGGWLTNWAVLVFVTVAFVAGLFLLADQAANQRARHAIEVGRLRLWLTACRKTLIDRRTAWTSALQKGAVVPQLRIVVHHLLGDDRDSLLSVEDHDGLKDAHNPRYVVPTQAERQLRQKMAQIDGGTIAVCGPRGAGKSTLLRSCTDRKSTRTFDLSVFIQAPAEYAPQEFLLTLFGEVCEKYLKEFSLDPAETGVFVAIRKRRIVRTIVQAVRWLVALALGLAALAAALGRGAQWLYERYATPEMVDQIRRWSQPGLDAAVGWWHDHPWISGILLTFIGWWLLPRFRRRLTGPTLAQECQRYLYRLRTVQSSSTAVNYGLPPVQGVSLGTSRTTSVSSVPFTFPELVADFSELLEKIARQVSRVFGGRVIIAIDELDRLGDAVTARKFLGQIKAIFGIKGVYYLISVAEDVGAAFVRRGLPHRDVTDSSLDDLLHLQPRTVAESKNLLAVRAPNLSPPYVLLLHGLSGGIPRDLIRYARRLIEVHHWTDRKELKDLAPTMILEELADTLEGFRTLLAMKDWTADGGPLLNRLYVLVRLLRSPHERLAVEARTRIQYLADNPVPGLSQNAAGTAADALGDDTRALWQEASACAYFSLTLLQIFGAPDFDSRFEQAQDDVMNGDPQRLAEARQELAVSPYSARLLLDDIRAAWGLTPSNPWIDPH